MATTKRGKAGTKNESPIRVQPPQYRMNRGMMVADVLADVVIEMNVTTGQPVTVTVSHDEALQLLADLANRLAQRVNPPKPIVPAFPTTARKLPPGKIPASTR